MIWPAYTIQSYRQNPGDRMKQSKLSVDQMVENNIVFNKEYLSIEDEEIHCIASKGNQVAIGLDTRICLFSNDTAIILNAPDLGSWSALHLDSAGNYLYAGNRSGELFRINLSTYEIEMNSVLVGTISCIKAVKKSDTEYVAASLINGEIAIFKTQASEDKIKWFDLKAWYQRITLESKENQFNWKDITPLRLSPQRCKGEVFDLASICFDQSNNCVLGGYYDGSIRIWPISPDILAEEICKASDKSGEEPNQALMDSLIKARYNAQQLPIKSIGTYLCP
jgi:WD40 repeat protein